MSKEYNVEDFAKEAGVTPETARVMLRNAGIKKDGRAYVWGSMAEVKKAVDKCRNAKPAAKAAPKKTAKKTAKKKVKKPAKKVTRKDQTTA